MREDMVYISGSIGETDKNLYIVAQYMRSDFDDGQTLDSVSAIFLKYGRRWRPAQKLAKFINESCKRSVSWESIPDYVKNHVKRELEKYQLVLKDTITETV